MIHDEMGRGDTIVNITHNMEVIDGQILDGLGHDNNDCFGLASGDNRLKQTLVVFVLIRQLFVFIERSSSTNLSKRPSINNRTL